MKINPSIDTRDYEYIYSIVFDSLRDEKVGQGDGKVNINFHNFFGLLSLVNSKMSTNGERIRGEECDIFREVFWDLFRDGFISLGNLESQSKGIDYEISYESLECLTFPYFRLTDKFYDFVSKETHKIVVMNKWRNFPRIVLNFIKSVLVFLLKYVGTIISLVKIWSK